MALKMSEKRFAELENRWSQVRAYRLETFEATLHFSGSNQGLEKLPPRPRGGLHALSEQINRVLRLKVSCPTSNPYKKAFECNYIEALLQAIAQVYLV